MKKERKKITIKDTQYADYEPDGRDLIEQETAAKEFLENNPNYDPEDHWISIETDKTLGK